MIEIAANIFWVDGINANVYLGFDDEQVIFIDTGMPGKKAINLMLYALKRLGKRPSDVQYILLTHADADHAGNAAALYAETGALIYASREAAELLKTGSSPSHGKGLIGRAISRFSRYPAVAADAIQVISPTHSPLPILGELTIIPTPGHTLDHLSFFHPQTGVLFAGDALNTRQGRLQCTPRMISADMRLAYESAARLCDLSPTFVACGHGDPLGTHTAQLLLEKRHEWLTAKATFEENL